METVEGPGKTGQRRALVFPHLPDRAVALLGMPILPRAALALGLEPAIELLKAAETGTRAEDIIARVANLIFDLSLLPARRRRASHGLDQIMRAHLLEATIEAARDLPA